MRSLVLNDHSTDNTFNVVRNLSSRKSSGRKSAPLIKVYQGRDLPEGWVGKSWACYQISKKARGEWFFFTDADTWQKPYMLKATVQMAEGKKADVLTLFTRQITKTWMETLVIPVMAFNLMAFQPVRWSTRKKSFFNRFAGVSGQFVFIKKSVYRALGGHRVVKQEIVEVLLQLGKAIVRAGFHLVYGDGSNFSFCRMYTSAREVWLGFSKNFYPGVGFSPIYLLNALIVLLLDGVLPFIMIAFGPLFSVLSSLDSFLSCLGSSTQSSDPLWIPQGVGFIPSPGSFLIRSDCLEFHEMVLVSGSTDPGKGGL